jgi:O-phosphoseryl-tRNA synthetase
MSVWEEVDILNEENEQPEETKPQQPSSLGTVVDYLTGKGTAHPLNEFIQQVRASLLGMGFDEIEIPLFLQLDELNRQLGYMARPVLNYSYLISSFSEDAEALTGKGLEDFLKGMNGLTEQQKSDYREGLKAVISQMRKGQIFPEDLLESVGRKLDLNARDASELVQELFSIADKSPHPTKEIIRSHMSAIWLPTLNNIYHSSTLPVKLFSIGKKSKHKEWEGPRHMRNYTTGSLTIMDQGLDVARAKMITEHIMKGLDISDFKIGKRKFTRPFMELDTECVVISKGSRIAAFGLFSSDLLDNYVIGCPVYYLSIGMERMLMARDGYEDMRELVFPQEHDAWSLTDLDIANSLTFTERPQTKLGEEIALAIIAACEKYGRESSPCSFQAWSGTVFVDRIRTKDKDGGESMKELPLDALRGKAFEVVVVEEEENQTLCGPAFLNPVLVKDGDIIGVLKEEGPKEEEKGAVPTGIRYLDAFAYLAAARIEEAFPIGRAEVGIRMISEMEEINLRLQSHAKRYILAHKKTVNIRGPLLTNVLLRPLKDEGNAKEIKEGQEKNGDKDGEEFRVEFIKSQQPFPPATTKKD